MGTKELCSRVLGVQVTDSEKKEADTLVTNHSHVAVISKSLQTGILPTEDGSKLEVLIIPKLLIKELAGVDIPQR